MKDGYAVTVTRYGEPILTIEETCLSGRDLSEGDEAAVREASRHLQSFVGDGKPQACFACNQTPGGPHADDCPLFDTEGTQTDE